MFIKLLKLSFCFINSLKRTLLSCEGRYQIQKRKHQFNRHVILIVRHWSYKLIIIGQKWPFCFSHQSSILLAIRKTEESFYRQKWHFFCSKNRSVIFQKFRGHNCLFPFFNWEQFLDKFLGWTQNPVFCKNLARHF